MIPATVTPGGLAAADQWLAAVEEVNHFASGYLGLTEDKRTEAVVLELLSAPWRGLVRDSGQDLPSAMDGRILVLWTNGKVQQLSPGWQLVDIARPARVGRSGEICDRCERVESLPAAYVVPAPPTLIGLAVCADCAIEINDGYCVPWVG